MVLTSITLCMEIKMQYLIPSSDIIKSIKEICNDAIKSHFLPQSIKTPEQAFMIALKGSELKLPITAAWSSINVINGKPAMSAELMRALIYRDVPGAKIEITEHNSEKCVMSFTRPGQVPYITEFSIDDAKKAGIYQNSWLKYTKSLLLARCTSQGARAIFPDILMGVSYTPEELGAQVDETGEIKDVSPKEEPKSIIEQIKAPPPQDMDSALSRLSKMPKPETDELEAALNQDPEVYDFDPKTKFGPGQYMGKTLMEVLNIDSAQEFKYAKYWEKAQRDGGKIPSHISDYLKLCQIEKVF